ncbi:MAG TPA: DinB family protein [Terriglobales bacterium]|jgi:uncharacterized damage-inducible protein DinB|nr:DinB family protein [Terriglobales bacterium]
MNALPIWFERKFDFAFPVELHPNLRARLRGTPARLEEIIYGVDPEILVRKPQENDKWSAQEHAGHLADLETLWLARVDDYINNESPLTAADLTNRKTFAAQHNRRAVQEILAEFRSARAQLLGKLENIDRAMYARTALHPRLKTPMRLVDHLYFVAEHDDHHLAYIWELIGAA